MPNPNTVTVIVEFEASDASLLKEFLERAGKGDLVLARYKTVWTRLAQLFPGTPPTQAEG